MSSESKFHPSIELLDEYTQGSLSLGFSIVVSAHIELCLSCTETTAELQSKAVDAWLGISEPQQAQNFSHLIDDIVVQPQDKSIQVSDPLDTHIHLPDRRVELPRVLAKAASTGLTWNKLRCGIDQASVELDHETQCGFDYFNPGAKSPDHSHHGREITLVLDGRFSDELGDYKAADFILRDREHQHQPQSDGGCLCFSVLDKPIKLTGRIARLYNPILYYKFQKARARRD